MTVVTLETAKADLHALIEQAAQGEEVLIQDAQGRAFKLALSAPPSKVPQFGIAKGSIWMADDFDAPLPEFEEYGP